MLLSKSLHCVSTLLLACQVRPPLVELRCSRPALCADDASSPPLPPPPPRPPPPPPTPVTISLLPSDLPGDTLVIEEPNEAVWLDERLEFSGLRSDGRTPRALLSHLVSFQLPSGVGCHAFSGMGEPLARFDWTPKGPQALTDPERLALILDLLNAINHLHSRGSAHLDLSSQSVCVERGGSTDGNANANADANADAKADAKADGNVNANCRLVIVGLGAAVRLQAAPGRSAFQLVGRPAFLAPETIGGAALIESNLRALMLMDAWAVGVLISMIVGSLNESPFASEADFLRGEFSEEAASRRAIGERKERFGAWLLELDRGGGGFLFRHGWLVQLLIRLLEPAPRDRLTVHSAWRIARDAAQGMSRAARETKSALQAASGQEAPRGRGGGRGRGRGRGRGDGGSKEFERFRKLARQHEDGEPFRSLEAMINIAERRRASVILESREWKGLRNYGEVVGFRNRADGDRWDVFVPGLEGELPLDVPFPLRRVLGVVLVKGGNHKLAVELAPPNRPLSPERIAADVRAFMDVYSSTHPAGARLKYLEIDREETDDDDAMSS